MLVLGEVDVGRLIAGKYELVRLIGKGAMGEVWLATHNSLGGEFAIKLVKPSDDDADESAAGRFQLEAQISAKLSRRTRHIVSVIDHGEEDGVAYLVMELLEGESLDARIQRTGQVPLDETVAIALQIARALAQAHAEGIFHRDMKPANVFLTRDEDGRLLVKLLDFGVARSTKPFRTRSPVMTGKDMVLGTPSYMSPEQARGLSTLDHRCDLWALGVVTYEALAGTIPWEGESVEDIFLAICTHRMIPLAERRPDLSPAVQAIFTRSFAEKLDQRFRTAVELSDALESLVDPMAIEAAMGVVPKSPGSGRRLPSGHDLASAMAVGRPPQMSADPTGVGEGGPTELMRRQKRSSGWLVAVIAALVTIGVILLVLRSLTSRAAVTSTPLSPPASAVMAPTEVIPPPAEHTPPPTQTRTAAAATPLKPARPTTTTKAPANVVAPPPAALVPVVTAAPPTHAVAPPPPPTAPKPRDQSEVF